MKIKLLKEMRNLHINQGETETRAHFGKHEQSGHFEIGIYPNSNPALSYRKFENV
jgi:hypothetical protein